MSGELSEYAYGKIKIRVMKLNRHGEGTAGEKHDVHELTVKTLLYGDFADAWTVGSNSKIIATETQKNTVYQLARTSNCSSPEDFGKLIAAHFLNSYNWVKKAQITLWEDPWARIEVNGQQHAHAFTKNTTERRYAEVVHERGRAPQITGGVFNLIVLKTTQSSFTNFVGHKGSYMENDKWCTLGEVNDRIFSTAIESTWKYASAEANFNECYAHVKAAFLDMFAGDPVKGIPSPSAQLTQHDMCKEALKRCKRQIGEISITTPNLHYMPLSSLVIPAHMHADKKDVFYPIDGPSGYITSTATLPKAKL